MANSPVMTVRTPEDRLARITARAKAAGLTRTQYVLDRADPEGATPRATKPVDMVRPTTGCLHPKEKRRVLGWGTMCDQCGSKVR